MFFSYCHHIKKRGVYKIFMHLIFLLYGNAVSFCGGAVSRGKPYIFSVTVWLLLSEIFAFGVCFCQHTFGCVGRRVGCFNQAKNQHNISHKTQEGFFSLLYSRHSLSEICMSDVKFFFFWIHLWLFLSGNLDKSSTEVACSIDQDSSVFWNEKSGWRQVKSRAGRVP